MGKSSLPSFLGLAFLPASFARDGGMGMSLGIIG